MKWMQFITPVASIDWQEAHNLREKYGDEEVIFLDVRQPREYEAAHLPGAKLIPLGELDKRLTELESKQQIVIY